MHPQLSGFDMYGNPTADNTFVFTDVTCTNGQCISNQLHSIVRDPFGFEAEPLIIAGAAGGMAMGLVHPLIAAAIGISAWISYENRKNRPKSAYEERLIDSGY